MKRLLLLLLVCGIYVCVFAQIDISKVNNTEISGKWVMAPVKGMKKGLGRLDMNFPDSVYWWVIIYDHADKMIKSFYPHEKKRSFTLAPGLYRVELSNVRVENVPIEEGHATRLKSGAATIQSTEEYWQLYNESKEDFFTSSALFGGTAYREFEKMRKNSDPDNHRKLKLALPVGNYQLKEGENYTAIAIKDESWDIKIESLNIGNFEKWVIVNPDSVLSENKGRLIASFPNYEKSWDWTSSYRQIVIVYPNQANYAVYKDSIYIEDLIPGNYRVLYDGIKLENVPIKPGKETRLKTGTIGMSHGSWRLYSLSYENYKVYFPNENNISGANNSSHLIVPSKTKIALPVGYYLIGLEDPDNLYKEVYYKIEIKDNSWVDIDFIKDIPPSITDRYVTNKIPDNINGLGKLNLDFPKDADWDVKIFGKNDKIPLETYSNDPQIKPGRNSVPPKSINLTPGKYDISLSNYIIKNVWIYKDFETRLKAGILHIASIGNWSLSYFISNMVTPDQSKIFLTSGTKPQKMVLPLCINGYYELTLNGKSYILNLKDGEIVNY